jgi:hypothetical protein
MSFVRAAFIAVQAIANHVANTAPNPSPVEGRYHTDELFIFRIAPRVFEVSAGPFFDLQVLILFFQVEQPIVWILAVLEITTIFILNGLIPISPSIQSLVCPAPNPNIQLTVPFVAGVSFVLLSTFTLLHCYRTLGRHFTYHLTIRDQHELVTSGLYNYVCHIIFGSWNMHSK